MAAEVEPVHKKALQLETAETETEALITPETGGHTCVTFQGTQHVTFTVHTCVEYV